MSKNVSQVTRQKSQTNRENRELLDGNRNATNTINLTENENHNHNSNNENKNSSLNYNTFLLIKNKLLTDLKREEDSDENVTVMPTTVIDPNANEEKEDDIEDCFKLIDSQLKHGYHDDLDKVGDPDLDQLD